MNANREPPERASNGEDSRLQEDVVAFERVVPGDFFVEHTCVTCGYHAALFVIAGGRFFGRYVSLCPLCASHRIQRFRQEVDVMPMWVASGVFFSAQRFPDAVQPLIRALPLTAAIDALRAIMLQGAGAVQVAPEAGVLTAWLVVCFVLALKLFRWK